MEKDIKEIISQMTLEEKASLCSGLDNWHTKPIERLGIPSIMMSDGPHGLRKEDENSGEGILKKACRQHVFQPQLLQHVPGTGN